MEYHILGAKRANGRDARKNFMGAQAYRLNCVVHVDQ